MKFKKVFKKVAAFVMAAVTALSVIPATTAFATTGDIGTISFSLTYDGAETPCDTIRAQTSAAIPQAVQAIINTVCLLTAMLPFCIQPGVPLKTGNTLKEASSETWNALSDSQKKGGRACPSLWVSG